MRMFYTAVQMVQMVTNKDEQNRIYSVYNAK